MKEATLFTFEVDIHMSCPSCGLFFRYRNNEIPEHKSTVHTCEGCDEQLTVPAFFIDMYPKKKREKRGGTCCLFLLFYWVNVNKKSGDCECFFTALASMYCLSVLRYLVISISKK